MAATLTRLGIASRSLEFQGGALEIKSWRRLAEIGQFDPHYLHLRKPPL
jgi:hypothetical protein